GLRRGWGKTGLAVAAATAATATAAAGVADLVATAGAGLAERAGRRREVSRRARLRPDGTRRAPVTVTALVVTLVFGGVMVLGLAADAVAGSYLLSGGLAVAARVAPGSVRLPPLPQSSTMYAADGTVVAVLHGEQNRQPVPLARVSPNLVNAVVDTEDADFWKHGGVSARGLARALTKNISSGSIRQGGSTLAEQLVKNTLVDPGHNLLKKADEMLVADRLEDQIGRRGVLSRYLNTVYFGEGAYGAQAAAATYFGIPAADLDPAQAALLAGIIQDPGGYDPLAHPRAAARRRAVVLALMAEHHHLTSTAAAAARTEGLPGTLHLPPAVHDYFGAAVEQELLADPRMGSTYQQRYRRLFEGGLSIHTTADPRLQREAESSVAAGIPQGHHLSAALVAIEPSDGAVRAVVGGPDFGSSKFDAALAGAGRQPGSTFKAFTLITALAQGDTPNDYIDGSTPCTIPNPGGNPDPWKPSNFEGEAFGPISLTDATAKSVNCAFARLAIKVGLGNIARTAHDMGITSRLNLVPSMTLGTDVVTPLQMASAYSTLAADGVHHKPHLVSEVDGPDGRPVLRNNSTGSRVLDRTVARETTQVLTQVVRHGTGGAAAVPGHDVAGKTGTAENYADAWFVGYTPQLAVAVWMGDPSGEVPMRDVDGINVVGGSYPASLWSSFMSQALAGQPSEPFVAPDGSTYRPSQQLSSPGESTGRGSTLPTTWCMSSCGK
ncbi:MAG TPA: transglycosylase domain-containing protein, partial [Acidimicrobiales bacterium]|nr:transglycosylase domain-containing protein [Acidimicrobiales bacterium]